MNETFATSELSRAIRCVSAANFKTGHQSDERVLQWLQSIEPAIDVLRREQNLGPDLNNPENLRLLCKSAAWSLSQLPGLSPSVLKDLNRFRNAKPLMFFRSGVLFTFDYFSSKIPTISEDLRRLKWIRERSQIRVLDVGSGEGLFSCWVLTSSLFASNCRVASVDFGRSDDWQTLVMKENLLQLGVSDKVDLIRGSFMTDLKTLHARGQRYDVAYLRGRAGGSKLEVLSLVWQMLQPQGLLIFDDYGLHENVLGSALWPASQIRRTADLFLARLTGSCDVIRSEYLLTLTPREH